LVVPYNLASELTQITYPSGRVVKQDFDAIGRLSKLYKDGTTTYADNFTYNVAGQVTGFKYNGASDFTAPFVFSADRLQLTSITYQKGATKLLDLAYGYGAASGNNGQILSITDNTGTAEAGRSVTYSYDALYRLKTAVTSGTTQYPQWGLSWTYDRYGNRTAQSVTAGSGPSNSLTINATTNRITDTGFVYDENGNLTAEPAPVSASYTYDAENRQVAATVGSSSGAYVSDGSALRVKKCVPNCTSPTATTIYVFSGSKVVAEYENGAGVTSPTREHIYLGSQLLAKSEGGTLTYYHQDHLSNRVMTNTSGSITAQSGHFPFGENWYARDGSGSSVTPDKLKFTSYERDAESGNDYAIFRAYINRFGRFSSKDPIAGFLENPQSLNLFAYTLNDPIGLSDPLGLFPMQNPCQTGFEAACSASGSESPVYYVDGRQVDAQTARNMGAAGFAVRCPGNDCAKTKALAGNTIVQVVEVCAYLGNQKVGCSIYVYISTTAPNKDATKADPRRDGFEKMGALVAGFELLVHPIHNLIVGNMMIFSGGVLVAAGGAFTGTVCAMGPAACVFVGIPLGGTVIAGGGTLIYGGFRSFIHLFKGPETPQKNNGGRQ
jgi:RHS repeat-associated protein